MEQHKVVKPHYAPTCDRLYDRLNQLMGVDEPFVSSPQALAQIRVDQYDPNVSP